MFLEWNLKIQFSDSFILILIGSSRSMFFEEPHIGNFKIDCNIAKAMQLKEKDNYFKD